VTDERNTLKKTTLHRLEKALAVLVCLLFVFSILVPFYHVDYEFLSQIPERGGFYSNVFWSFKAQYQGSTLYWEHSWSDYVVHVYWFFDHGFYDDIPGPMLSPIFLLILAAQILALVMGILFILKRRSVHALVGTILCLAVTISMVYVKLFHSEPIRSATITVNSYEIGFWSTCLSVFLFLSLFIVSRFSK
jgi:hypothetical protein